MCICFSYPVILKYVSLAYRIFIKNFPFRYCPLVEVD